jgi:hypothetical protein
MPSKSYKEKENEFSSKSLRERLSEKTRGKKRYLERIVDEREAEKQIKEFDREEEPDEFKTNDRVGRWNPGG